MRIVGNQLGHWFDPEQRLFTDVGFIVGPGDLVAVVGPSGSGKSTLLNLIAGWETPREGTLEVHGVHRISWVFQNPHGIPGRLVLDQAALPYLARGMTRREAEAHALVALDAVGLTGSARKRYRDLSGGEAQRLMMARAIGASPDLLLMDEPTAQLDPASSLTVIDVLEQLAASGPAVIIATHDQRVRDRCHLIVDLGGER